MTKGFIYLFTIVGFGLPTVFLIAGGFYFAALFPVALSAIWLLVLKPVRIWIHNIIFVLAITLEALAINVILNPTSVLFSAVFILAAWDLTHWQALLDRVGSENRQVRVEQDHLQKIVSFTGVTAVLGLGAISINLQTTFIQAVILLVLSLIGVLQLVRWLLDGSKTAD